MGSYCDLRIDGYDIFAMKSSIDTFMAALFRETDRRKRRVRWDQYYTQPLEDGDLVDSHQYVLTAGQTKDRLEVMGFTLGKARVAFDQGIVRVLKSIEDQLLWEEQGCLNESTQKTLHQWQHLQKEGIEGWTRSLQKIVEKKTSRFLANETQPSSLDAIDSIILGDDPTFTGSVYMGYPSYDFGLFLRAVIETVEPTKEVILDITSLIHAGYYQEDEAVCHNALNAELKAVLPYQKLLVLTEGRSDSALLVRALKLLYPHLADYISFMDFGMAKSEGGVAALDRAVRSFAAAGVSNKIIALFDYDAAGVSNYKALHALNLPKNIKPLLLSNLPLADCYPTIGPQGDVDVNVNGRACSIEMYLGKQVLSKEDGTYLPVIWTSLEGRTREYQGEIENKPGIQKQFAKIMDKTENGDLPLAAHDWTGLQSIFQMLFLEASSL
jgi:hypothetical protein